MRLKGLNVVIIIYMLYIFHLEYYKCTIAKYFFVSLHNLTINDTQNAYA